MILAQKKKKAIDDSRLVSFYRKNFFTSTSSQRRFFIKQFDIHCDLWLTKFRPSGTMRERMPDSGGGAKANGEMNSRPERQDEFPNRLPEKKKDCGIRRKAGMPTTTPSRLIVAHFPASVHRIWLKEVKFMPRFLNEKVKRSLYLKTIVDGVDIMEAVKVLDISVSQAYALVKLYRGRIADMVDSVIGGKDKDGNAMDPVQQDRAILSAALNCRSSTEGIMRHLEDVHGVHVSIGEISETIQKYSDKAKAILASISLGSINTICADEIFEGQTPAMTVIDPKTTYVISLLMAPDRTADTWQLVMEDSMAQGLSPQRCISDAGTGLQCGIPRAFKGIDMQVDCLHIMKDMGEGCRNVINSFFSRLGELEKAYDQILYGKNHSSKADQKCTELERDIEWYYERAYAIETLAAWMREMPGFTGYSAEEVRETLLWIADELASVGVRRSSFRQKVKAFRKQVGKATGYLKALEKNIGTLAESMGYEPHVFRNMYRLSCMGTVHPMFQEMHGEPRQALKADYDEAMRLVKELVKSTCRASSIVENLNSRVRPYMNAKRFIPEGFFPLLQLYFNTKKYRRSEVPERVGKSPLELLTGEHRDFYELLGL